MSTIPSPRLILYYARGLALHRASRVATIGEGRQTAILPIFLPPRALRGLVPTLAVAQELRCFPVDLDIINNKYIVQVHAHCVGPGRTTNIPHGVAKLLPFAKYFLLPSVPAIVRPLVLGAHSAQMALPEAMLENT